MVAHRRIIRVFVTSWSGVNESGCILFHLAVIAFIQVVALRIPLVLVFRPEHNFLFESITFDHVIWSVISFSNIW